MQKPRLLRPQTKLISEQSAGPGVATRKRKRRKPRFSPLATKLMSEKSAAGDFFPI
jgi:hypothetical protein